MSATQKRLLRYLLLSGLTALLIILCTPLLTVAAIRTWIWWKTRDSKVQCVVGKIDAPFLRPVELRDVHLTANQDLRLDLTAPRVTLALHWGSILRTRGHSIRQLDAENVHCEIHRNQPRPFVTAQGWSDLERLLPDSFRLVNADLRLEDGATTVAMRGLSLSGSAVENGVFAISRASVTSPHLQREFNQLRGATTWQDDRLTISAVTLASGLDLRSLKIDLSQLGDERLGLELDLDAFRGRIRANISDDWRAIQSNWNIAGSATDISLAQTSQSLGFTDQINGLLHACKFTFRGNTHDPKQATASIWTELTHLSWRNRVADVIMIGASLYNQQVQLQQLYVKQSANQLNLSGEAVFPTKNFDWFNPNFSGNISASIADLGAFANLFGAHPGDFAGKVAVEGTINASDRKFGGHLNAAAGALSIFQTQFESLAAKFNLTSNAFQIEQLELHRQRDFLRAEGTIDLQGDHAYSGKASMSSASLAGDISLLPASWQKMVRDGQVDAEWNGHGKSNAHYGTVHVHGEKLRVPGKNEVAPFSAEIEAEYSPVQTFFRQMHFTNAHASLNGFATLAATYMQLQGLAFDLNGKPILRGNIFLPIAAGQLLAGATLADVTNAEGKADVDLNIEETDLREFSQAVFGHDLIFGKFAARASVFGSISALQGWSDWHGRDIILPGDSAGFAFDSEARFASGEMQLKGAVGFAGCDPVTFDGSVPVTMTKGDATPDSGSFSLNVNAPALFPARLPRFVTRDFVRDGILSGKLSIVGPEGNPALTGDMQLTNGKLNPMKTHLSDLSARLVFEGHKASIEFLNLGQPPLTLSLHGSVDFADSPFTRSRHRILERVNVRLTGFKSVVILSPIGKPNVCINDLRIEPTPSPETLQLDADQIAIFADWTSGSWNIAVSRGNDIPGGPLPGTALNALSMPLCLGDEAGMPLLVASDAPAGAKTEKANTGRKKSRRRR